jgi:hypothetical protein
MNLLTVIPTWSGDSPTAEMLIDWIFQLRDRKQADSILVVCYGDTHEEMRLKLSIAAEVAYEHFEMVIAPEISSPSKTDRVNHVFNFAADHISRNYRSPWLWLEPDSVPLKRLWLENLSEAYDNQPKRHLGPHFQTADKRIFMGRSSIYSPVLVQPNLPQFTTVSSDVMTASSTKTRLIQQIFYKHPQDLEKIRQDAVLLHSDKSGELIKHLRSKL